MTNQIQTIVSIFGICVVSIESKTAIGSKHSETKNFIYKWAPFAAIIGGKGLTYVFFGELSDRQNQD